MSVLVAKNDFNRTVYIEDANPSTFAATPVTTGTVTAFIASSNDPDATAANVALSVSATHVGVSTPTSVQYPLGTWGISIDGSVLTTALLDPLFNGTGVTPYLVVTTSGGLRRYQKLRYLRSLAADVVV